MSMVSATTPARAATPAYAAGVNLLKRDNRMSTQSRPRRNRRGFTLLQIIIVMAVISILAVISVGAFGRARASARRAQCDVRLKSIALALDAHRQESGRFPRKLAELQTKGYLRDADALRCPSDPRRDGSYEEYYVIRAPRDRAELPIVVCPFHEENHRGGQAFIGRYTHQFATRPATLEGANAVTVQHPDDRQAIAGTTGMELHGGDRIRVATQGAATIRFADNSTATLRGGSDVTVLQSFVEGQSQAPLYTLVRQTLGEVAYRVNTGSKFDVVTPTATAGAHGTAFTITVDATGNTSILVTQGKVSLATLQRAAWAPLNLLTGILPALPGLPSLLP
jgi:prepilin-type N-terminal cleavage/methylation domain-containing protein